MLCYGHANKTYCCCCCCWFSADPLADFADKSSATLKVGGEADSLSPVGQVRLQYRRVTCVAKPRVRVAALVFTSPFFWGHCQEGIVKRGGLVRNGCVISLVRETHVTDVTEVSFWFSASGLLTVIAPGTVHSCRQVILYHSLFFSCQLLGWDRLSCCCC